jgi:2-C-methyl-D-erythritol 4-phosphate cytidylyltransferase / 2-C-methyl-D-erythritol 2,4-cyclodiphosphate synthase
MIIDALLLAAGSGSRLGGIPKQYRMLGAQSVLARSVLAFQRHAAVRSVRVAISPEHRSLYDKAVQGLTLPAPILGGQTRQDSVRLGLAACAGADAVLIHDAARPFVSAAVIDGVVAALATHQGASPALPVVDSLRRDTLEPVAREGLFRMQTPQGFHLAPLIAAHASADEGHTDDVSVARAAGLDVALTAGDEDNFKITSDADWIRAQMLGQTQMIPCMGTGFDVHRFGPNADGSNDHLWLCGVRVPHSSGLLGHSDADVGLHALTDAILGALGDGDIGQHFPPTDARWRGAPSWRFLAHARDLVRARGGRITHVDVTLICERPKVGPHRALMRTRLHEILELPEERISVKATTTEELGFTGRREGIAAQAAATLLLPDVNP